MLMKNLTSNDKELLNIVYKYGGYIRVKHLKYIYPDLSERSFSYKLDRLSELGCLTKRRYLTNSKIEPVTYQITQAGCNICGNRNSTYRRKRPVEYAYRALLKNVFCMENHKLLEEFIITDLEQKRKIFEDNGFNPQFYPKKINTNKKINEQISTVQFEEILLDFRESSNVSLKNNNVILYESGRVVVVYIDQPHIEISKQIATLTNRYINMVFQNINNGIGFKIDFLIVVDNDLRVELYNNIVEKILDSVRYQAKISTFIEKIYVEYYEKLYKKSTIYNDRYLEILKLHKEGKLLRTLIERAKVVSQKYRKTDDVFDIFRTQNNKYISDNIYNIMVNNSDIEMGRQKVEEFFDILFACEYLNVCYFGEENLLKYNIKMYKTETNIFG